MKDKTQKKPVGRPATKTKVIKKSSEIGTKENETRATFIVNENLLGKMKAMAYWDRVMIKDVIERAFQDAVDKYVKENGPIKPIK